MEMVMGKNCHMGRRGKKEYRMANIQRRWSLSVDGNHVKTIVMSGGKGCTMSKHPKSSIIKSGD